MSAESLQDLIDVKFQDATNHVSFTSDDIMGMVMPYYWGEADKMRVYGKSAFYEMFPESLPIGVKSITNNDRDLYSGYAQVKAYFAHGGGQVEVYRPSKGFGYQRMTIKNDAVSEMGFAQDGKQHDETAAVSIALKYAGFVPQSLASGFDNIAVKIEKVSANDLPGYNDTDAIKISVQGCKFSTTGYTYKYTAVAGTGTSVTTGNPKKNGWYVSDGQQTPTYTLSTDTTVGEKTYYEKQINARAYSDFVDLEVFKGSTNPLANIDGESIYLENVIKSNFIDVRVFDVVNNDNITTTTSVCESYDNNKYTFTTTDDVNLESISGVTVTSDIIDGVYAAYKYFKDFEVSTCTLLVNPFVDSSKYKYSDIDSEIASIAEYRKNLMAVIGYPVNRTYDYDNILSYFYDNSENNGQVASKAMGNKFCIALQGREIISLFGYRYTLNCVAGYCGKMINIANEQHLNQIASGQVYGIYGGSLKETLLSGEVINLMDVGINSVYTSNRGNIIFGTRTMYSRQESYFGKINVMRVTAAILKNIFPICIDVLHTDVASNPITRASFASAVSSVIGRFITNKDLHDDSYANCDDSINTDALTKGGTELNFILALHYIGITERINLKVIATDTSVTAEFV